MDEWIEIEGRNRKDAIERACNALNTNSSHLKYEIISEGKSTKIRAMKVETDRAYERDERDANRDEEESTEGEAELTGIEEVSEGPPSVEEKVEEKREGRDEKRRDDRPRKPVPPDAGEKAREALLTIVQHIDPSAEVELHETDEAIELEIRGERGGVLIGKYGQTLSALQYLVAKMIGLDRVDGKRLVLDSEEYLARRRESLTVLAERLADKAMRTRRPVGAEPMSASDRRVLHVALAEDPDVTTKSIGEGASRRVLIVPKGYDERNSRRNGRGGGGRSSGRSDRNSRGGSGPGKFSEGRRRSGPPPRKHDSFDAPAEPEGDFFEEENAPLISGSENEDVGNRRRDSDD